MLANWLDRSFVSLSPAIVITVGSANATLDTEKMDNASMTEKTRAPIRRMQAFLGIQCNAVGGGFMADLQAGGIAHSGEGDPSGVA
jgi:hypothetical protein